MLATQPMLLPLRKSRLFLCAALAVWLVSGCARQAAAPATEPGATTPTIQTGVGRFVGLIDANSIEIETPDGPRAFRLDGEPDVLPPGLQTGEAVTYEYYERVVEAGDRPSATQLVLVRIAPVPGEAFNPAPTRDILVYVEGEEERRPGVLTRSDNGYTLYTLPDFRLVAEEPRRDVLLWERDDRFFARIERLPRDAAIGALRENAHRELRDLGTVHEMRGEQIFAPPLRRSEFFLHASTAQLSKNIVVIRKSDALFRFTVHIPNTEAAEGIGPSLWAMLQTIEPMDRPALTAP